MTDWQFIGCTENAREQEIIKALRENISDLDFEIDIDLILTYIQCANRLIQRLKHGNSQNMISVDDLKEDTIAYLNIDEVYDTPEKLIFHFKTLYDNPNARFNKLLWKSAIEHVVKHNNNRLEIFCKPIADFLLNYYYLKSDVLRLIANAFPFVSFFPTYKEEQNQEFWQQYGYAYQLLKSGNLEFDLYADTVNTGLYTSNQLDDIYFRLKYATHACREKKYMPGYNLLSKIPIEMKPLVVWHRELAILYKAHVKEKDDNLRSIFINTINNAISFFPDDEHLLYMRCKYLFYSTPPETCKEEIIATLKKIPTHYKCLFLLGKCYMQLGVYRASLIIFEKLKKLNPLNMEYVTATALASRKYIDFCIQEHDPDDNDSAYYIKMISELTKLNMFDEVYTFAAKAPPNNADIKALLAYAKAVENHLFKGIKEKNLLQEALTLTNNKKIRRNIKEFYLRSLPTWGEVIEEKEFILDFYKEYPDDSMANYQLGMLYYANSDYENAYIYLLKAKEIDPENIENYYNLSRATSQIKRYEEAIEYIQTYVLYNKYSLDAYSHYCTLLYWVKDYYNAHMKAEWVLSLCDKKDFLPKHFFYFTASLSLYLEKIEEEKRNHSYIRDVLELYDTYPKPATFWTDDYGSKSMFWAAKLCFQINDHEKCIEYLQYILKNVKEYKWTLREECLFDLLPKSMHSANKFEELIEAIEKPTLDLLNEVKHNPKASQTCYYIAHAYGELGMFENKFDWALNCVYCYKKSYDPPIEWLGRYLINNFEICLYHDVIQYVIPIGKAYLEIITTVNPNYIYITHYMANAYCDYEQNEEGASYHRDCIDYGKMFPGKHTDLISKSQLFIDNHTSSDVSK